MYKVAVCSVLTYGSEMWILDSVTCRTINGVNSKMLSFFTGKTVREESMVESSTFDILIYTVRTRRLDLGNIPILIYLLIQFQNLYIV